MTGIIEVTNLEALDRALEEVPNNPAVFLLFPREGRPYLAKTGLLRRRLLRLLKHREQPSRLLNLRHTVVRIEYHLTGSAFESAVKMYELAREHFPDSYLDLLKLRMPPYIKLVLGNEYPRTHITTSLSRNGMFFGPFRSRASAELFEGQFLDFFQIRRCQDDLKPDPEHPGCIYGEMGMCLRPCQEVVGRQEYQNEVARVTEFLQSGGTSLIRSIETARDRFSEEMMFEEAARQHKRLEKVQEVMRLRDDLAREVDHLHGIAITPAADYQAVQLWLVRNGIWLGGHAFSLAAPDGRPIPLDRRLRELIECKPVPRPTVRDRQEYLALLARWYYSTWREGEWLALDSFDTIPYRKLVHAVSKVGKRA